MNVNRQYYSYLDPVTQDTERTVDGKYVYYKAPEGYNIAIIPKDLSTFTRVESAIRLQLGDCGIITPTPDADAPTWKDGVAPIPFVKGQLITWTFALTDVATAAANTTLTEIILVDGLHPDYISQYTQIGTDGIKRKVVSYNVPDGVANFKATFQVFASNGKSTKKEFTFLARTTEGTEIFGLYRGFSTNGAEITIGGDSDTLPYFTMITYPQAESGRAGRRQMQRIDPPYGPIDVLNNRYTNFAVVFPGMVAGNYSAKVEHLGQVKYLKWVIDTDGTRREKIVFYDTNPLGPNEGSVADPTWDAVLTTNVFQRQTYSELVPTGYTLGNGQSIKSIEIIGVAPDGFTLTLINNVYQIVYAVPANTPVGFQYVKLRLTQTNGRYVDTTRSFYVNVLDFYTYIDVNPQGGNNKLRLFTSPQQPGGYKITLEGPNNVTLTDLDFEVFESVLPPAPAAGGETYIYRNIQNLATVLTNNPGLWIVTQRTNYPSGTQKTLYAQFDAPIVTTGFKLAWQTIKPTRPVTGGPGQTYYIKFSVDQLIEGGQAIARLYKHIEGQGASQDTIVSGAEFFIAVATTRTDVTLNSSTGVIVAAVNQVPNDSFYFYVGAKLNGVSLGISSGLYILDKSSAGVGTTDEAYEDLTGYVQTSGNQPFAIDKIVTVNGSNYTMGWIWRLPSGYENWKYKVQIVGGTTYNFESMSNSAPNCDENNYCYGIQSTGLANGTQVILSWSPDV